MLSPEVTVPPTVEEPTPIFTLTPTPKFGNMTMPVISEDNLTPLQRSESDLPTQAPIVTFVCVHKFKLVSLFQLFLISILPYPILVRTLLPIFMLVIFVNMQCTGPEQVIEDINNIAVGVRVKNPRCS